MNTQGLNEREDWFLKPFLLVRVLVGGWFVMLVAVGYEPHLEEFDEVSERQSSDRTIGSNRVWLRDRYPPISGADIDSFEDEFQIQLPKDYRSFLLANNGGTFYDCVVSTRDDVIEMFHALGNDLSNRGLRLEPHFSDSNMLAVGDTNRGDPVCISLAPDTFGAVFVYDSVLPHISDPEWHKLANSFTEFYESLRTNFQMMQEDEEVEDVAFLAILKNDQRVLNEYLDDGLSPDHKDSTGKTPLMYTVTHSRIEIMDLLLERGADIHAADRRRGQTALFYAAGWGVVEASLLLVKHGAAIEARDKSGKSVLIWAIRAGACRVASELIKLGADVNYRTPDGRTAMNSCENLTLDYVRPKLLAAGAKD